MLPPAIFATPMDGLQQIIHSLTPAEKRYFKMFALSFKTESKLITLFDELSKEDDADDKALSKKLKAKNLSVLRSDLRKLLLRAMRNYREENHPGERLRAALSEIEFLTNKNLNAEARKEIHKLQKLATETESYSTLAELVIRTVLNMEQIKDRDELFNYFKARQAELQQAADGLNQYYGAVLFQSLSARYFNVFDYENSQLRQQHSRQFLQQAETAAGSVRSLRAKIMYHENAASQHLNLRQYPEARKHYAASMHVYDQHPHLWEFPNNMFFFSLSEQLVFSIRIKDADLTKALLLRVEKWMQLKHEFLAANPQVLDRVNTRLLSTRVQLALMENDAKNAFVLEAELLRLLHLPRPSRDNTMLLLAVMYFTLLLNNTGHSDKALQWIENYYLLPNAKAVKVAYLLMRFIEVAIFYNQGNLHLANNKAMNLYKTFTESELTESFYKVMGRFLRKLGKWNLRDAKDRKECEAVILEMEKLAEADEHSAELFLDMVDLRKWLLTEK